MAIKNIDIGGTLHSYWEYVAACRVCDQLERRKHHGLIEVNDAKELQELQERIEQYESDQNIYE